MVGFSAGVIAALEGGAVTLVGYDGIRRVSEAAGEIKKRFDVEVTPADGSDDAKKGRLLTDTEVVITAGRAGVRVLSKAQIEAARNLLVVADVNAVPPSGVEGLEVTADNARLTEAGALGIGPLTIGGLKYKTEAGLFRKMITATKPVHFDFRDAFALARELNA